MTALLRLLVRALAALADAVLAPSQVDLAARLDPWHVGGYRAGTKPVDQFRLPPPSTTAHRSP